MPRAQTTIAAPVTLEGVTLFTGAQSSCTIAPAPASSGIRFRRASAIIDAHARNLADDPVHPAFARTAPRCTALRSPDDPGAIVWTTEHVLAALRGLGIDNATITLDAPEPPILDGSALGFTRALTRARVTELDAPVETVVVTNTVRVERAGAYIEITPGPTTRYEYTIDYGDDAPIRRATAAWDADPDDFAARIAPARTFCLEHEAHAMRDLGLFTHLTERDMLVIGEDGPIGTTLRDPNECALHKLLDLIGDLALVGGPIIGRVRAHASGHALAHDAARALSRA